MKTYIKKTNITTEFSVLKLQRAMILTWVMVPRVRHLMAFFKTMNFTLSFINVLGSNPKENNKGFYMFPCLKQDLKAFIGQLHRRTSYLESRIPI